MAAAAADMVDKMGSSSITATRSPQYRFAESVKKAASASVPWSQVAAAQAEPQPVVVVAAPPVVEPAAAVASSSSSSASSSTAGDDSGPNGGIGKKASWSRPSVGVGAEAAGPVVEVEYWPALSEVATGGKSSRKSSSESVKSSVDRLSPISQGPGNTFTSPSSHPPSERQLNSHADGHPNVNIPMSMRQKSMKRNNGNPPSNGDAPQSPGPRNPAVDSQPSNSSLRDDSQRSGSASENHGGNEQQQPHRNSFKNRSGGAYQRRDGSHSQNYGNRRDHDRGNQEWNSHRGGFNHNREGRMQQQRGYPRNGGFHPPGPVIRPASGPFIPPPQPQNFDRPPYPGMPHPPMYYFPVQHPMDFASPMQPMQPHMVYIPQPDPTLPEKIMNQVNYYFSNDNLVKDPYLRQNMDDEGWVPVALIAGFKKVSQLTGNIQLILDIVRTSPLVEVQGDKLRRRNDWNKWIMPPAIRFPALGAQSSSDSVAASVQSLSLGERVGNGDAGNAEADAPADSSTGTGS